ncbi:cation acetate symporter [Geotalea sp. SG265]|uniref:solute symporter family protein n=1 Tax=Geotalea sp. SG265 TaxID=2922867 RepID=UPI001FB0474E|nr:cation acetate symporter [Geotalea sp. SG265]
MKRLLLIITLALIFSVVAYAAEAGPTSVPSPAATTVAPATAAQPGAASAHALIKEQPAPAKTLKTNRKLTVSMFLAIIASTVMILIWSSSKNKTAADYYAAGGGISGMQNGWAIAGDTLSAATFLGTTGLISLFGLDGFMYAVGPTICFLTILLIIAEPCRNAGKYTLGDILSLRSGSKMVRGASALSAVVISSFYLVVQMVGAGKLMQLLLGIPYQLAVVGVGAMIVVYVSFGGMKATTWVQIIKAALLLSTTVILSLVVLWKSGMNPLHLLDQVAASSAVQDHVRALLKQPVAVQGKDYGQAFLEVGLFLKDPLDQISVGIAMLFGVAGLPHIMMRFFTVPDAKQARKSVVIAMSLIATFQLTVTILGLGAALYVTPQQIMAIDKGGNMAALMMTQFIGGGPGTIGGDLLLAFICAVAFATVIAVVSGLVLASSAAIAHDLYVNIIKKGDCEQHQQVRVAKLASFWVGSIAILLAIACEKQNVVVLATLAFAVAASSNFPVILFSLFWKRFNTAGITCGLVIGATTTIALVLVSPNMTYPKKVAAEAQKTVLALEKKQAGGIRLSDKEQGLLIKARGDYALNRDGKSLLGLDGPLFPLKNPGIVSVPIGFMAAVFGTLLFRNREEEEMFAEIYVRQNTGLGIAEAAEH